MNRGEYERARNWAPRLPYNELIFDNWGRTGFDRAASSFSWRVEAHAGLVKSVQKNVQRAPIRSRSLTNWLRDSPSTPARRGIEDSRLAEIRDLQGSNREALLQIG